MPLKVDDYMIKKWDRVFYTFFDTNRNGVVDWGDFEVLFEKVKELRGEESKEYKIIQDAMLTVWKGMLMNVKGLSMTDEVPHDAEITLDEWHDIWKTYDPRHMTVWQWEYLKFMFFLIDSSGDKFVDVEEYSEVMKIYGLEPKESALAFSCFALDHKGNKIAQIDYGMFVQLWNEFFGSNDPNKRGAWLFGIVE
jgi:Ca2+-binding EF-hand superfamily protein